MDPVLAASLTNFLMFSNQSRDLSAPAAMQQLPQILPAIPEEAAFDLQVKCTLCQGHFKKKGFSDLNQ